MGKTQIIPVYPGMYAVAFDYKPDGSGYTETRYPVLAVEVQPAEQGLACRDVLLFSDREGILSSKKIRISRYGHDHFKRESKRSGPVTIHPGGSTPVTAADEPGVLSQMEALRRSKTEK